MLHVALLRGINLAGRRSVAMADLRAFAETLGLAEVRTLLNSGNLVFGSTGQSSAELEQRFEAESEKHLGFRTDFHVRSATELHAMIKDNPFPREAKRDPARLIVFFLKKAPGGKAIVTLQEAITGRERVLGQGRHAFIYYPDGQGRSKLTLTMIDKAIGVGTGRNWNTVTKLLRLTATA
jgi:uncharacterized protein (DUF1697 family)